MKWGIGLTCLIGVGCLLLFGVPLTNLSYDLLVRAHAGIGPTNIIIVYVNEESLQRLGRPRDHLLDRKHYASLIRKCQEVQPNIVVFDFLFSAPSTNSLSDQELAEAMRAHGSVVAPVRIEREEIMGSLHLSVQESIPEVQGAVRESGHVELPVKYPLVVRGFPLDYPIARYIGPVVQGLVQGQGTPGSRELEDRWINYYGPPDGNVFASFPLHALVSEARLDTFFRNKVIWVGERSGAGGIGALRKDYHRTPFGKEAAGVEIHATILGNLLRDEALRLAPLWGQFILMVLWGALLGIVVTSVSKRAAIVPAAGAFLCVVAAAWWLKEVSHYFFAWLVPAVVQPATALTAALVLRPKLPCVAFISYRRKDSAAADLILKHLEERGFTAFIDRQLRYGDFPTQLRTKIEELPFFILVVTERTFAPKQNQKDTDYVLEELRHAWRCKRERIIPFLFAPLPPADSAGESKLPEDLGELHKLQNISYNRESPQLSMDRLAEFVGGARD